MKTLNLIVALCVMLPLASWAQTEPLPVDPAYRIGQLENGLTYYIRHNEYPENQCCFYIAQKVGSMQEEEDQRGLAHLLEHMAFNGTEHFPGGRLIKFLEENGIKFGAELNAYTSLEETVYNIDAVPTNKGEALLDSCLQILADWSGGVSLLDEEIDKERGVVKSEYLMRNSASQRMLESMLETIMSGSKYAFRMPIGLMDVVENCPYEALRSYYKKWYHPSYQGIIVVGDIDVDKMEQKIKQMFSKFTNPENYAPIVQEVVPDNDEPIFATAKDKEQKNTDIYLFFKYNRFPKELQLTFSYPPYDLMESFVSYMAYNRVDELCKKPESPVLQAYASPEDYILSSNNGAFNVFGRAKPGKELESYKMLLREAIRMSKYGFTPDEFNRAKLEIMSSLQSQYEERNKVENSTYVNECVEHYLRSKPIMSIADGYELYTKMIDQITLDDVNKLAASFINTTGKNLVAFNYSPEADGQFYFSNDIYKTATQEVLAEDIQPMVDNTKLVPLIKKLPKAGSIVYKDCDPLTGARILKLSNGAVVYTKKTDYKDNEIIFAAHSFGGSSLYEVGEERNLKYLDYIMSNVGLSNQSQTSVEKHLAGRNVSLSASVNLLSEGLSGQSVNKDIESLFTLIHCYFRYPGSNVADFQNIQQQIRQQISTASLDPRSALSDSIQAIRYNHNPRNMRLTVEDVDRMDFKRMCSIYKERFADPGDFTFYFVGSFDEAELDKLICKYIASIKGGKKKETFRTHTMDFNTEYVFCCTEREMATPESRIQKYYTLQNVDYNLCNMVTYSIVSQILDQRYFKAIREESSIAYHSGCRMYFYPSETNGKADLTFVASNPLKPEYANVANRMMDSIMTAALDKGFTQDELDNVRAFMVKNHTENLRVNNYWLTMMQRKFVYGGDFISDFDSIINGIDTDMLHEALKTFINASFTHTYMLLPEGVVQVE